MNDYIPIFTTPDDTGVQVTQEDTRANRDPDPYRLYAIVRIDIGMDRGKIASQASHAVLDSYLEASEHRPDTIPLYKTNHGIKICMAAKNSHLLEKAYEEAKAAGLPCALITDLAYCGLPDELLGKPIITALGIGPAKRSETDKILRRFQLMS